MLAEVDVPSPALRTGFDTQPQTFEQAQAGAVEEFGLELEGAVRGDVEVDVAGNPMDVGLFGAVGVVFGAKDVARLVEQFGFGHHLPALLALERRLPMRCLPYSEVDHISNLRASRIQVSNLRLNK